MVFVPELLSVQHAAVAQCDRLSESVRGCGADVLLIFQ